MQVKTTRRYLHVHWDGTLRKKRQQKTARVGGESGRLGHCQWGCEMVKPVENRMVVPQKMKHRITKCSSDSTSGYLPPKMEREPPRAICIPRIRAASFTVATYGSHLSAQWMEKQNVAYTRDGIAFCLEREGSVALWYNISDPRGCYAKWNKSVTERQILHDLYNLNETPRRVKILETEWWLPGEGGRRQEFQFCEMKSPGDGWGDGCTTLFNTTEPCTWNG